MARALMNRLNFILNQIEHTIGNIFGNNLPPAIQCAVISNHNDCIPKLTSNSNKLISLKDIIEEGILWAAPKTRRPIEKRLSRRFGYKEYFWKLIEPKQNLLMCPKCGHDHEAGLLCNHCYSRVKVETKEMQEAIVNNLGLQPVEKDIIVLYEGEKQSDLKSYWKGQRIVELPKKRPAWFHSNLLQPTTQEPALSNEVKPTELA